MQLISSAEETAKEVAETLARREHLAPPGAPARSIFATTGDPSEFARLGGRVFGSPLGEVLPVTVSELTPLPGARLDLIGDPATEEASCA